MNVNKQIVGGKVTPLKKIPNLRYVSAPLFIFIFLRLLCYLSYRGQTCVDVESDAAVPVAG